MDSKIKELAAIGAILSRLEYPKTDQDLQLPGFGRDGDCMEWAIARGLNNMNASRLMEFLMDKEFPF